MGPVKKRPFSKCSDNNTGLTRTSKVSPLSPVTCVRRAGEEVGLYDHGSLAQPGGAAPLYGDGQGFKSLKNQLAEV